MSELSRVIESLLNPPRKEEEVDDCVGYIVNISDDILARMCKSFPFVASGEMTEIWRYGLTLLMRELMEE